MISPKGLYQLVQLALFFGQAPSPGEAASLWTRADNSRTVAPANWIVVKPSGASASEFTSLQAAVNSIGSATKPTCIFLDSGTFNERVEIKVKVPLTLYGSKDFAAYNIGFVNGYTAGQVSIRYHGSRKDVKHRIDCCPDGKWQQNWILRLLLQVEPGYSICQGWLDVLL
jgi:pectinesterase